MIRSGRGSGNNAAGSPGFMSRRGRGRGSAVGVSAGSNSWRRGEPSTMTKSAGTFAASNSWVRPKDGDAEKKKDVESTETTASAVELALASIEGKAEEYKERAILAREEKDTTEAIDRDNQDTDDTSKSKGSLDKRKIDSPQKDVPNPLLKNPPPKKAATKKATPKKPSQKKKPILKGGYISELKPSVDTAKIDSLRKSILDSPPKKPVLKGGPKPFGGSKVWKRKNDEETPPPRNLSAKGNGKPGRNTTGNRPGTKAQAAKRIRLGKITDDTSTTNQNDADGTDNNDTEEQAKEDSGNGATLTAFAYRETGNTGRGRGRGRGRGSRGRGNAHTSRGNMGLVRVKSELQSTTKICPTFARGINCDDEYCRKRHDVPPECARPLCSFFQRHGQCRKGDECPFAHVKVDPRAAICSSFRLLGYCEDPNCPFKHVVQK